MRDLAKKYRNIRSDTQLVIEEIQKGNFIGERIPRLDTDYLIYKVRVNNSNIQKGKRAGYRLIYQVESETSVLLLIIYSKSEKEDINVSDLLNILNNFYN